MIASLPMYDWVELRSAHQALWALIRDNLRAVHHPAPENLDLDIGLWEAWKDPQLVLGQTCGMPFRTALCGTVNTVGSVDYGLSDAPCGYYYSQMVVRADAYGDFTDYQHKTLAFNGHDSQSGWAAPQNDAEQHGFIFTHTLHTGAHRESARAVARGNADIAAIDAITWRLIRTHMPETAAQLRVLTRTTPTPGLPLITALNRDPAPITRAVTDAIDALPSLDKTTLGIVGLAAVPDSAYLAIPTPPPPSQDTPQN